MTIKHVVVIGAGAGGLAAAIDLARQGIAVTVLDKAEHAGGKMRQLKVGDAEIDAGPTVFTMGWVFEALFARAGADFRSAVATENADILARHAWTSGGILDLHADHDLSLKAIRSFSDHNNAAGYERFCERSALMYRTLKDTFMANQKPNAFSLTMRVGLRHLGNLLRTAPQRSLWNHLGDYFSDARLRQLFARYATYVGSSPIQCPATLMLIAHVEQSGVGLLPGGMRSLASAMQTLAEQHGATFRFAEGVTRIDTRFGRACGVTLDSGEHIAADAVVFNGDQTALANGLLGDEVRTATPGMTAEQRGLSAITWCLNAKTSGFPLHYHNVFFDDDYPCEFSTLFKRRRLPARPTVYVCAQDRLGNASPQGAERLLILINAPADGVADSVPDGGTEAWGSDYKREAWNRAQSVMSACGLNILTDESPEAVTTTPDEFAQLFPATGGSLYGRASHGMMSSFQRPGARSRVPGLYLSGGSVHPGPGVPMATFSGTLAAAAIAADSASTS